MQGLTDLILDYCCSARLQNRSSVRYMPISKKDYARIKIDEDYGHLIKAAVMMAEGHMLPLKFQVHPDRDSYYASFGWLNYPDRTIKLLPSLFSEAAALSLVPEGKLLVGPGYADRTKVTDSGHVYYYAMPQHPDDIWAIPLPSTWVPVTKWL